MKLFCIVINLCNIFPQKCNAISSLFFILVIRQNRISAVQQDDKHCLHLFTTGHAESRAQDAAEPEQNTEMLMRT